MKNTCLQAIQLLHQHLKNANKLHHFIAFSQLKSKSKCVGYDNLTSDAFRSGPLARNFAIKKYNSETEKIVHSPLSIYIPLSNSDVFCTKQKNTFTETVFRFTIKWASNIITYQVLHLN